MRLGADATEADKYGKTALHYSAGCGHAAVVELLVTLGADVTATASNRLYSGLTALHLSAGSGHAAVVELLVRLGADVTATATNNQIHGLTALHYSAHSGHAVVVESLLALGADVTAATSNGQTACDLARAKRHSNVVMVLSCKRLQAELEFFASKAEAKRLGEEARQLEEEAKQLEEEADDLRSSANCVITLSPTNDQDIGSYNSPRLSPSLLDRGRLLVD